MSNALILMVVLIVGGIVIGYIAAHVKIWRDAEHDEHEEGGP